MKVDKPDVSSWLIEASKKNNSLVADSRWLNGDAIAIIIAGSDTVAPTLVFLFYELALNKGHTDRLYEELQTIDIHDRTALQGLPLLNGLINETLRLHPPVPSGGYRETPAQGLTVAGQYIPGKTTIVSPRYTIGRRKPCLR
jgi:cytochrome P450